MFGMVSIAHPHKYRSIRQKEKLTESYRRILIIRRISHKKIKLKLKLYIVKKLMYTKQKYFFIIINEEMHICIFAL